ncbi:unnamed protein product [Candidula unifasciata]|uniref:Thioredoxin domain-containing protein n=1 Tax=Candidula unifasciata TaxID=100452 RepID=A0A8S4A2U1_9EUPU|nr:unnamed protein product [Candidula unifasciata]
MPCFKWEALLPKPPPPKGGFFGASSTTTPKQDAYVGSSSVFALDDQNFKPFLRTKDMALVMFYQTNCKNCDFSKKHFKKASETTKRDNHAYAAVDCKKTPELCCAEDIPFIPYFKLYCRGRFVGFNGDYKLFVHKNMKRWVESMTAFTQMGHKIEPCRTK